ncbi:MAG: DUF364 domain-containing protein, partial [Bacteroidales bacterium]|nr:DUF364 domain-containing protein [Bacteroidales bacterium]
MDISEQTLKILQERYNINLKNTFIEDVRIGVFYTSVRLNNQSCGLAATQITADLHCHRMLRNPEPFTTSHITGQNLYDLFYNSRPTKITETLKIASLNALSENFLNDNHYKIVSDKDPVSLVDLSVSKTISIVGAFKSYIENLAESKHRLFILELNEGAIDERYRKYYI